MVQRARRAIRTSWVSVTLAGVLGVTMPTAASMAGTALASPIARATASGLSVRVLHPVGIGVPTEAPGPAREKDRQLSAHTRWDRASLLVHVPTGGIAARRNPWPGAPTLGTVAATSKY